MSNSIAVQSLDSTFGQTVNNEEQLTTQAQTVRPALKVVPPQHTEPPTLEMLTALYATQERECWLCQGIARKVAEGKEISEDDNWHFTSCVLSWEYLHRNSG